MPGPNGPGVEGEEQKNSGGAGRPEAGLVL